MNAHDSECYSLTSIEVDGDVQDVFEVYADATKEQTIAFVFDESLIPGILALVRKA